MGEAQGALLRVVKQQSPKPFKGMDGAIPEDCITCGVEPVEG